MKARVRIRKATLRDLPLLVRHRRAMWEDFTDVSSSALDRGDVIYRLWLQKRMRAKTTVAFVAETPAGLSIASGAVFLRDIDPFPDAPSTSPHIISMFTEKEHRGKGIASRILRELVNWCQAEGFRGVTLSPAPKARPLYRRVGFERAWMMVMRFPNSKPKGRTRVGRRR